MRRDRGSSSRRHPRSEGRPNAGDIWSDVIKPALYIGLAGAGAVLYLVACARISVIECDLGRLERVIESEQTAELGLQRQLAELRHVERIQSHIAERGLQSPSGHRHIVLGHVPASLYDTFPEQVDDVEIGVGQVAEGPERPLYAFAESLRIVGDH